MDTFSPNERALAAAHAWELARARGDDRLRLAALADYREARREQRRQVITIVDQQEAAAFLSEWSA
ncbi:MAG: hypothetical protein ABSE58_09035 [Candidatus Limnocylindrales bacterium]|jgi:serine protease inhibitor ecotin